MSRPVAFAVLTFPRSGSTWLMNMLDSHPEVAAYDELFLGSLVDMTLRSANSAHSGG